MYNFMSRGLLLSISLTLSSIAMANDQSDSQRYLIKFSPGKSVKAKATVKAFGGVLKVDLSARHNAAAYDLTLPTFNALTKNPNIEFIEIDHKRKLRSLEGVPYGVSMIEADLLSDSLASNQKICIIDSGIQLNHPELNENQVTGSNDSGTGDWHTDENGHGTHVAGTIAALQNGSGVVGVLPNGVAQLHIVKVFDANGWAYSSDLVSALDKCIAAGSNIINMSLGGSFSSSVEEAAFDAAYQSGILSVAAAGNDGNRRLSYPASYPGVISVAAVDEN